MLTADADPEDESCARQLDQRMHLAGNGNRMAKREQIDGGLDLEVAEGRHGRGVDQAVETPTAVERDVIANTQPIDARSGDRVDALA